MEWESASVDGSLYSDESLSALDRDAEKAAINASLSQNSTNFDHNVEGRLPPQYLPSFPLSEMTTDVESSKLFDAGKGSVQVVSMAPLAGDDLQLQNQEEEHMRLTKNVPEMVSELTLNATRVKPRQLKPMQESLDSTSDADSGEGHDAKAVPSSSGGEEVTNARVKFLCTFGGEIRPRAGDGKPTYIGGDTKIMVFDRVTSYTSMMYKMTEYYGQALTLKYQLPNADLDVLISVSSDDDVLNMMEEYDRVNARSGSDGSAWLRVFLFPADEQIQHPRGGDFGHVGSTSSPRNLRLQLPDRAEMSNQPSRHASSAVVLPNGIFQAESFTGFQGQAIAAPQPQAHPTSGPIVFPSQPAQPAPQFTSQLSTPLKTSNQSANISYNQPVSESYFNRRISRPSSREISPDSSESSSPHLIRNSPARQMSQQETGLNYISRGQRQSSEQDFPTLSHFLPQGKGEQFGEGAALTEDSPSPRQRENMARLAAHIIQNTDLQQQVGSTQVVGELPRPYFNSEDYQSKRVLPASSFPVENLPNMGAVTIESPLIPKIEQSESSSFLSSTQEQGDLATRTFGAGGVRYDGNHGSRTSTNYQARRDDSARPKDYVDYSSDQVQGAIPQQDQQQQFSRGGYVASGSRLDGNATLNDVLQSSQLHQPLGQHQMQHHALQPDEYDNQEIEWMFGKDPSQLRRLENPQNLDSSVLNPPVAQLGRPHSFGAHDTYYRKEPLRQADKQSMHHVYSDSALASQLPNPQRVEHHVYGDARFRHPIPRHPSQASYRDTLPPYLLQSPSSSSPASPRTHPRRPGTQSNHSVGMGHVPMPDQLARIGPQFADANAGGSALQQQASGTGSGMALGFDEHIWHGAGDDLVRNLPAGHRTSDLHTWQPENGRMTQSQLQAQQFGSSLQEDNPMRRRAHEYVGHAGYRDEQYAQHPQDALINTRQGYPGSSNNGQTFSQDAWTPPIQGHLPAPHRGHIPSVFQDAGSSGQLPGGPGDWLIGRTAPDGLQGYPNWRPNWDPRAGLSQQDTFVTKNGDERGVLLNISGQQGPFFGAEHQATRYSQFDGLPENIETVPGYADSSRISSPGRSSPRARHGSPRAYFDRLQPPPRDSLYGGHMQPHSYGKEGFHMLQPFENPSSWTSAKDTGIGGLPLERRPSDQEMQINMEVRRGHLAQSLAVQDEEEQQRGRMMNAHGKAGVSGFQGMRIDDRDRELSPHAGRHIGGRQPSSHALNTQSDPREGFDTHSQIQQAGNSKNVSPRIKPARSEFAMDDLIQLDEFTLPGPIRTKTVGASNRLYEMNAPLPEHAPGLRKVSSRPTIPDFSELSPIDEIGHRLSAARPSSFPDEYGMARPGKLGGFGDFQISIPPSQGSQHQFMDSPPQAMPQQIFQTSEVQPAGLRQPSSNYSNLGSPRSKVSSHQNSPPDSHHIVVPMGLPSPRNPIPSTSSSDHLMADEQLPQWLNYQAPISRAAPKQGASTFLENWRDFHVTGLEPPEMEDRDCEGWEFLSQNASDKFSGRLPPRCLPGIKDSQNMQQQQDTLSSQLEHLAEDVASSVLSTPPSHGSGMLHASEPPSKIISPHSTNTQNGGVSDTTHSVGVMASSSSRAEHQVVEDTVLGINTHGDASKAEEQIGVTTLSPDTTPVDRGVASHGFRQEELPTATNLSNLPQVTNSELGLISVKLSTSNCEGVVLQVEATEAEASDPVKAVVPAPISAAAIIVQQEATMKNGQEEVEPAEPQVSALLAEQEASAHGLQTIQNGDLEELKELGSGTYGTVYHGKWKGTDVAIKRIKSSLFQGPPKERDRLIADFWREASTLSQLHHPNVVAFYGVVSDGPDGSLATVTEYMVNGSLKQVLHKKDRTIDRRKRIIIAMDAAFGMEYLHSKQIVHFDLKCDNLLVNLKDPQRPICKVADLGLSKVKHKTMVSGGVRGTLPWMAPELLIGKTGLVTEKVDVFSFGICMWELLTGEEPYATMHYGAIIGGILKDSLRPPIPAFCDPQWRGLMESCWSNEPEKRPSFSKIALELRAMTTPPTRSGH